MEYERNIEPKFFLASLKAEERFDIINERLEDVFIANKVKSYTRELANG
jgi:hypothetical protein